MATVNLHLHTSQISPAMRLSRRSTQHVQNPVIPFAVSIDSTMRLQKIIKPAASQSCSVSNSKLRGNITVRASDIRNNGEMSLTPEIGVAVFILKDNKILVGRRCTLSIAANNYALPGGHLEFGESYEECAMREVKEETGLDIKNIEVLTSTNNLCPGGISLDITYVRACLSDPNQTPQNLEPEKCVGWEWCDLKNMPEPMYGPLKEMLQGGFNPFLVTV